MTVFPSDAGFNLDLEAARCGDVDAQGRVLESCRDYLRAIAGRGLGADLAVKVGASDLVQETLVGAHFDFTQFRGHTREALLAWLRVILHNRLGFVARHYRGTEKRRLDREIPSGDPTAGGLWNALLSNSSTPGGRLDRRESADSLFVALERLPEDYRRVVVWRQYDEIGFEEIGTRLGRSAEAARKIWSRALMRLSEELSPHHEP
ncbi:sigma-70 family RNA polymerase sigma factor [Singulisphaera rosea]